MRARRASFCAVLSVLVLAAACSSGADESGTPSASTDPAADTSSTLAGEAPASPSGGTPGRWDIDAALAADPNCPAPLADDPLIIGYAADRSEIGGPADVSASEAAVHFAKLINCSGGLNGRAVQVNVADVAGDPLTTRSGTIGLLQGGADVLLGPPFPDPGFRVLQATGGTVPVVFVGSTEPALADASELAFLVAFNDTQGATAAAQFARTQGWQRAVTFSAPGPYFGYTTRVFNGAFTAGGGQAIGDYPYAPFETEDFSEAVAQIAADPPDVIYTAMFANQLVALRDQLTAAGVQDVEFISSDAFEATGGYALSGTDGIFHVTHTFAEPGGRLERLMSSMSAANGLAPLAPSMAALGGDAIAVIADAYLRVGTTDPMAIGQAMTTATGVDGMTGVLSYNNSATPDKPMYIHKVVDGKPTLAGVIGG